MSYFSEQYNHSKNKLKVELDFSNYAQIADLNGGAGIDTSKFAKENGLSNLKSDVAVLDIYKLKTVPSTSNNLKIKVDKLNVDKLETVLVEWEKLSDVFDKDVAKNYNVVN